MDESFAAQARNVLQSARTLGARIYKGLYTVSQTLYGDIAAMLKLWMIYISSHVEPATHAISERNPIVMTTVYSFCEDTPPSIDDDPDWTDFFEMPRDQFSFETWEDTILRERGWTSFRIEVRYVYMNKKYRVVLRRGERAVMPPYSDDVADGGGRAKIRLPRGVLSARLASRDDNPTDDIDITGRVKKYAGPRGNFHGMSLRVRDMFPFDDHESNADRFAGVRIVDAWGRTKMFSYVDNDAVLLQPPPSFAMSEEPKSKDE